MYSYGTCYNCRSKMQTDYAGTGNRQSKTKNGNKQGLLKKAVLRAEDGQTPGKIRHFTNYKETIIVNGQNITCYFYFSLPESWDQVGARVVHPKDSYSDLFQETCTAGENCKIAAHRCTWFKCSSKKEPNGTDHHWSKWKLLHDHLRQSHHATWCSNCHIYYQYIEQYDHHVEKKPSCFNAQFR